MSEEPEEEFAVWTGGPDAMNESRNCRKCGTSLAPDNIKESLWFPPYCPACWPKRCPHCNVKEFYWSHHYDHPRCDSGCYINGAGFPAVE